MRRELVVSMPLLVVEAVVAEPLASVPNEKCGSSSVIDTTSLQGVGIQ